MQQFLHIFRKDLRCFRVQIAVLVFLTAAFAYADIRSEPPGFRLGSQASQAFDTLATVLRLLLNVSWIVFVVSLVQEESLAGDRQFWITRPYDWRSLLGAKLLFIAVTMHLPLVVAGCFILGLQGFSVISGIPWLLAGQPLLALLLVLPAFVIATLTRSLAQFMLASVLILVVLIGEMVVAIQRATRGVLKGGTGSVGFVSVGLSPSVLAILVVLTIAVFVILRQYSRRRTLEGRAIVIIAAILFIPSLWLIPKQHEVPLQDRSEGQKIDITHVALSLAADRPVVPNKQPDGVPWDSFTLPVRVAGLPPEADIESFNALVSFERPSLTGADVTREDRPNARLYLERGSYRTDLSVPANLYREIAKQPVTLRIAFDLAAVSNRAVFAAPLGQAEIHLPGIGICRLEWPTLLCRQALWRPPRTDVFVQGSGFRSDPFPMNIMGGLGPLIWGLSPVDKWVVMLGGDKEARGSELLFVPRYPLARFHRELVVTGLRLQ